MRSHDHDDPYVVIEKHSGSVGSFLFGLGVGAAVALLLAPQPGVETRRRVAGGARRASGAARERALGLADEVQTEVTERIDRARYAVTSRVDRARDAVELKRQQVQRAVEAGRVAAAHAREDLARRIAETKAAYQAGGAPAGRAAAGYGAGSAPGGYELAADGPDDGLDDALDARGPV